MVRVCRDGWIGWIRWCGPGWCGWIRTGGRRCRRRRGRPTGRWDRRPADGPGRRPGRRRLAAGLGSRGGPRVVGRGAATGAAAGGLAAAGTAAVAAAAAGATGADDLRGGPAQRGADLVDVDLERGALLALAGLPGAGPHPAVDDHPRALLERLGDVLGRLPPDRAAEEHGLAVLPLVGLLVERARRGGHGEVGHRRAGRGEAQLGVVGEVADDGDDGLACHVRSPGEGWVLWFGSGPSWRSAPTLGQGCPQRTEDQDAQ